MKKTVNCLVISFLMAATAQAQSFNLHIKNNAHIDLMYGFDIDHGAKGMMPGLINMDQTVDISFNPNPFTGVEGYFHIYPANQPDQKVTVYYNNPIIGTGTYTLWSSPLLQNKAIKWQSINSGTDYELTIEISNPNSSYGKPVPVALNSNGNIKGTILWDKKNILYPETNPFGNAFSFKVLAPAQFIESNGPFTLEKTGTYNGKKGFFEGSVQTGNISYETVQSLNPDFVEIKYTISGVPTDVPLQMDIIADQSKTKWISGSQKPKPGENYYFLVGTFSTGNAIKLTVENKINELSAVDFTCEGDWVEIDGNGNLTNLGSMINKIATRKNIPVLPANKMIISTNTLTASGQMIQAPAMQNKTQQVQVQKVSTGSAVRIRQQ